MEPGPGGGGDQLHLGVGQDPVTAERAAEQAGHTPTLGGGEQPGRSVWGAQRRSCSWPVFVEQTAEQIASTNLARLILVDNRQPSRSVRCLKPERSMRTMPVVVLDIDPQDLLQVASSYDQEPVQALGADRADPSFRVGVRPGRFHRRHQHLAAFRAEHVVEAAGELRVPVTEHEAHSSPSLLQHQQQVAGLLGNPAAVGVGGHPGQVHP